MKLCTKCGVDTMKPIFANLDAAADGNTEQETPTLGYAEYNPSRKIKQEAEDKL